MAETNVIGKRMVDRQEAAKMYGISPGTLANWACCGKGPRMYRVNRKILYRVDDLDSFFMSRPIETVDSVEIE